MGYFIVIIFVTILICAIIYDKCHNIGNEIKDPDESNLEETAEIQFEPDRQEVTEEPQKTSERPKPILEHQEPQKPKESERQEQSEKTQYNKTEKITNYYEKYPKPYRCKDGHEVRSKSEREIDNFFYENRIFHIYEQKYEHPITKDWAIPDFYLPDSNLYIEYFGLNTPEYNQKKRRKN